MVAAAIIGRRNAPGSYTAVNCLCLADSRPVSGVRSIVSNQGSVRQRSQSVVDLLSRVDVDEFH